MKQYQHSDSCSGCPMCSDELASILRMNSQEYARWLRKRTTSHAKYLKVMNGKAIAKPLSLRSALKKEAIEHALRDVDDTFSELLRMNGKSVTYKDNIGATVQRSFTTGPEGQIVLDDARRVIEEPPEPEQLNAHGVVKPKTLSKTLTTSHLRATQSNSNGVPKQCSLSSLFR